MYTILAMREAYIKIWLSNKPLIFLYSIQLFCLQTLLSLRRQCFHFVFGGHTGRTRRIGYAARQNVVLQINGKIVVYGIGQSVLDGLIQVLLQDVCFGQDLKRESKYQVKSIACHRSAAPTNKPFLGEPFPRPALGPIDRAPPSTPVATECTLCGRPTVGPVAIFVRPQFVSSTMRSERWTPRIRPTPLRVTQPSGRRTKLAFGRAPLRSGTNE